jgi:hypothetical protein
MMWFSFLADGKFSFLLVKWQFEVEQSAGVTLKAVESEV